MVATGGRVHSEETAIERLSLRRSAHHEVEEQIPMNARDVMSKPVVSVHPDTPLREIARLLIDKGISAVPVVDDKGAPIGMVSEGDLIRPDRAAKPGANPGWRSLRKASRSPPSFLPGCSGARRNSARWLPDNRRAPPERKMSWPRYG